MSYLSSLRRVPSFSFGVGCGGYGSVPTQGSLTPRRTPLEAALRFLGARRYDDLVAIIEQAIARPDGQVGKILAALTRATQVLEEWTPAERAQALWQVIVHSIADPYVGDTPQSRRRRVLHAAFRLPDDDVEGEWGTSLAERFKQLRTLRVFSELTSTQPMEISWKQGVERLADHLSGRLEELRTPEDWARYAARPPEPWRRSTEPTVFREPSEGAQKLFVNFYLMTVIMQGRAERRRLSERVITSQDDRGLRYYTAHAFASDSDLQKRTYSPIRALWGCRAENVPDGRASVTRLWFPRPLEKGERAHFLSEAWIEAAEANEGWANVEVDHFGIEAGELRDGVLPISGLTLRIRFDPDNLPSAVWWYAELNERERYTEPPLGSSRRLDVVEGDVVKTFERPCQPRESYGIAYRWA